MILSFRCSLPVTAFMYPPPPMPPMPPTSKKVNLVFNTPKEQLQELEPTLDKELVGFFLIMLHVVELRPDSLTVLTMVLESTTVSIQRMLE